MGQWVKELELEVFSSSKTIIFFESHSNSIYRYTFLATTLYPVILHTDM